MKAIRYGASRILLVLIVSNCAHFAEGGFSPEVPISCHLLPSDLGRAANGPAETAGGFPIALERALVLERPAAPWTQNARVAG